MIPQPAAPIQLADARRTITELVDILRPACERIEIAGSVRRGKLEVHDARTLG
jgi:DNA polymerase/3'-5' exonuclease PolX